MDTSPVSSSNSIRHISKPLPLSLEEMEKKISSITATQIEAIAKQMIGGLMARLNIDVTQNVPIPDWIYLDFEGKAHQVRATQYKSSSQLMQTLLLPVIKQITDAFSLPNQFIEKGVTFRWNQLMDKYSNDLKTKINKELDRIKNNWDFNEVELKTILELNRVETTKELHFNQTVYYNDFNIGTFGHVLENFEKAAQRRTAF